MERLWKGNPCLILAHQSKFTGIYEFNFAEVSLHEVVKDWGFKIKLS